MVGPAVFDGIVLTLDEIGFLQALAERGHAVVRHVSEGFIAEKSHHRHRWLLRPRSERPRCRTADQLDELPPLHSITSSARASTVEGTSRPSALAVLRLITSSYLVGACTGRSTGFSPLRMRSTYPAARRCWSIKSAPYEIKPPAATKCRSK